MLSRLSLTTANRPELLPDETLLYVQNAVGLYEGKSKLANYQNGFAYLTTHRTCYVDNTSPREYSVAIELKDVDRVEPYAGFLKSSPKITLYLKRSALSPASTERTTPAAIFQAAVWICPICSFSNPVPTNYVSGYPTPPCLTCGIKPPSSTLDNAKSAKPPSLPQSGDNTCPRCTFRNYPSLLTCELCGEPLSSNAAPPAPTPPPPPDIPPSATVIKISFRSGGHSVFLTHLRTALIQRRWLQTSAPPIPRPPSPSHRASPAAGVGGLENLALSARQRNVSAIGGAFSDLSSLMSQAKQMVALAESFAARFPGENTPVPVRAALGLVSKDMLNDEAAWIDELARQVVDFLGDGVLKREGGVMTLVDLWAVLNRARAGIDLVSPKDLEKAAERFEVLKLPVRIRRFRSGLVVVQERGRKEGEVLRAVVEWMGDGGVTVTEVAQRWQWSVGVATEEIESAEEMGLVCRDVCVEGIRFWRNRFLEDQLVV